MYNNKFTLCARKLQYLEQSSLDLEDPQGLEVMRRTRSPYCSRFLMAGGDGVGPDWIRGVLAELYKEKNTAKLGPGLNGSFIDSCEVKFGIKDKFKTAL